MNASMLSGRRSRGVTSSSGRERQISTDAVMGAPSMDWWRSTVMGGAPGVASALAAALVSSGSRPHAWDVCCINACMHIELPPF